LSVDYHLKEKLAREIVKDISPYLLGSDLPQELRSEFRHICGLNVYRNLVFHEIDMTPHEKEPGYLRVSWRCRYDVTNTAESSERFNFSVLVRAPEYKTGLVEEILEVGATNVVDQNGAPLQIAERAPTIGFEAGSDFARIWRREVFVPPRSSAQFWYQSIHYFPDSGEQTLYCRHATLRQTVKISYPEDVVVVATFGHRAGEHVRPTPETRPMLWELHHASLPMNALSIEWRRRAQQALAIPPAVG
jgi:hypothetical protein